MTLPPDLLEQFTEDCAEAVVALLREKGATNRTAVSVFLACLVNHAIAEGFPLGQTLKAIDVMYRFRLRQPIPVRVLVRLP